MFSATNLFLCRRDREKAVEKATKLEIECDFLRRQLEQSQGRQMEALADRRQQSLMNQQRQYYGDNYSPQVSRVNIYFGCSI